LIVLLCACLCVAFIMSRRGSQLRGRSCDARSDASAELKETLQKVEEQPRRRSKSVSQQVPPSAAPRSSRASLSQPEVPPPQVPPSAAPRASRASLSQPEEAKDAAREAAMANRGHVIYRYNYNPMRQRLMVRASALMRAQSQDSAAFKAAALEAAATDETDSKEEEITDAEASPDASTASPPREADEDPKPWQPRTMNYFHRPSSVARLGENPAVTDFNAWAQSIPMGWLMLHEMFVKDAANPAGGEHMFRGNQPMLGLSKKRWIRLVMNKGYPDEAGLSVVFDEIAKECNDEGKPALLQIQDMPDPEITLPQLKRFERRVVSVNAALVARDGNSPAARFVKWIKNKYGTTLFAWRTVLDTHETGRVGYSDFLNGCRTMGMGNLGKLVWNNLKQDKVHPMELHELDPKEGANLEAFAETLWSTVGCDANKGWLFLDGSNQNFLTWEQFRAGVAKLGFRGDVRLLFKGLDVSGLGRVKKDELKYVSKVSRIAQRKFGAGHQITKGAMTEVVAWAQREMGGADSLMTKLGLGGSMKEVPVTDLAARLTALGFEGDALAAAAGVAKKENGSTVNAEAFYNLINSNKRAADCRPESPKIMVSTRNKMIPTEWSHGADDFSEMNAQRSKYDRGYFGPPVLPGAVDRDPNTNALIHDTRGGSPSSQPLKQRLPWDGGCDDLCDQNSHRCKYDRGYFGGEVSTATMVHKRPNSPTESFAADKSVRDQQRTVVQDRLHRRYGSRAAAMVRA